MPDEVQDRFKALKVLYVSLISHFFLWKPHFTH
jgi:hypothetical protein